MSIGDIRQRDRRFARYVFGDGGRVADQHIAGDDALVRFAPVAIPGDLVADHVVGIGLVGFDHRQELFDTPDLRKPLTLGQKGQLVGQCGKILVPKRRHDYSLA